MKMSVMVLALGLGACTAATDGGISDYRDRDNRNPAQTSVDLDQPGPSTSDRGGRSNASQSADRGSQSASNGSGPSATARSDRGRPFLLPECSLPLGILGSIFLLSH
jgi:hypothetical protein